MPDKVIIDGSKGEGGGQILRTSLSLSAVTGRPFQIINIRKKRRNPGLGNQHLAAVLAAGKICGARMSGHRLGSMDLSFEPEEIKNGEYRFQVPTAGSALLVFQTVLPILALAPGPSRVELEGGTHNPWAPPFDFIQESFLPLLAGMGLAVKLELVRPGFFPAGGGRVRGTVEPFWGEAARTDFLEKGSPGRVSGEVLISGLPTDIARREAQVVARMLGIPPQDIKITQVTNAAGPGNVVIIRAVYGRIIHLFTAFGMRGKRAEQVAREACRQLQEFQASPAALDEHLANQVVLYLALRGGGSLSVPALSAHTATNLEVIQHFLEREVVVEREPGGAVIITIN